ncbi:MAG TPA: hypothetical protein EYO33_24290 [Phycisphaerales bacterium]|nr:hypothetical protein [Phycisphaerales bacterium]
MNFQNLTRYALTTLLLAGLALADSPQVNRQVGEDGVPVITIKGSKSSPRTKKPRPVELEISQPSRPAFKVYDLGGAETEERAEEPTVVVIGNPPPIAPNPGAYNNWFGNGFYNNFFATPYGPGFFPTPGFQGYYRNGFVNSVNFEAGVGFRQGFQNYIAPPVNYTQPIINYRQPVPVRYTGGFPGFRGCPGRF